MHNRIRQLRKQRGMTLASLAEAVGTTPQTVSRLETEVMTLSTDWLQRFAAVLNVHPADLLESPDRPSIDLVGTLGREGMGRIRVAESFDLDIPAERPVAVRLTERCGPYEAGDVLIGNRVDGDNRSNAAGRDVIAGLDWVLANHAASSAHGDTELVHHMINRNAFA